MLTDAGKVKNTDEFDQSAADSFRIDLQPVVLCDFN